MASMYLPPSSDVTGVPGYTVRTAAPLQGSTTSILRVQFAPRTRVQSTLSMTERGGAFPLKHILNDGVP